MYPPSFKPAGVLEGDKQAHVDELLRCVPACRLANPSRTLIDLPDIRMPNGQSTTLRISLDPDFPLVAPHLRVLSDVSHAWIKSDGTFKQLGALQTWNATTSRLLHAVADAYEALTGYSLPLNKPAPPTPLPPPQPLPHPQPQPQPQPLPQPLPDIEAKLQQLDDDALVALITNDDRYKDFALQLLHASSLYKAVEDAQRVTRNIAAANLHKERELSELRDQINIIRSTEYNTTRANFEQRYAQMKSLLSVADVDMIKAMLASSASEADKHSEELLDGFLASSMPLEVFLEEYLTARERFHERDIKCRAAAETL